VDTGSQISLVNIAFVRTQLPVAPVRVCGVTGDCMDMYGPVEVEIELGYPVKRYLVLFFGVHMKDDCILGVDYLTAQEAVVDFGGRELHVSDD